MQCDSTLWGTWQIESWMHRAMFNRLYSSVSILFSGGFLLRLVPDLPNVCMVAGRPRFASCTNFTVAILEWPHLNSWALQSSVVNNQGQMSMKMAIKIFLGFGWIETRRSKFGHIFDRELVLMVLYICFCLILVLLPNLNFQAQIGNFSFNYFPFPNWNIFFCLIGIFFFFWLKYFPFSNWNDFLFLSEIYQKFAKFADR